VKCCWCYLQLGETDRAKSAADEASRHILPKDAQGHHVLSSAYERAGIVEAAFHHGYLAQEHGADDAFKGAFVGLALRHFDENTKKRYVEAFHRIVSEAPVFRGAKDSDEETGIQNQSQAPEGAILQRIEVNAPEDLLHLTREQLPDSETVENIDKTIRTYRFPVGMVAEITGSTMPEAWRRLTEGHHDRLKSDSGQADIVRKEQTAAADATHIVVDIPPLLTLDRLELLSQLPVVFEEVCIPQEAFDDLQAAIGKEKQVEGKPRRYVVPDPNSQAGASYHEEPSDLHDSFLQSMERVRDFIQQSDSVRIIGKSLGRDDSLDLIPRNEDKLRETEKEISPDGQKAKTSSTDDGDEERLRESPTKTVSSPENGASAGNGFKHEHLGQPVVELLREGIEQKLTIYAEDVAIRDLARLHATETFGTRAFLHAMRKKGDISAATFAESEIRLLEMGFEFPVVHISTILQTIENEGFPASKTQQVLRALHHSGNDPQSLFLIGTQVILWLWTTHQGPAYAVGQARLTVLWTWRVLDAIAGNERFGLARILIQFFHVNRSTFEPAIDPEHWRLRPREHRWVDLIETFRHWLDARKSSS